MTIHRTSTPASGGWKDIHAAYKAEREAVREGSVKKDSVQPDIDMVERVARALCAHDELEWDDQANPMTSGSGDDNRYAYLSAAIAVIEAMREPTPAMFLAGGAERTEGWIVVNRDSEASREAPQYVGATGAKRVWSAMIDAALSETVAQNPEAGGE